MAGVPVYPPCVAVIVKLAPAFTVVPAHVPLLLAEEPMVNAAGRMEKRSPEQPTCAAEVMRTRTSRHAELMVKLTAGVLLPPGKLTTCDAPAMALQFDQQLLAKAPVLLE